MPLARYFFFVGGALLALLLMLDAYLPRIAVRQKPTVNLPIIRIHSDLKWPERIVFDTRAPTIIAAQSAGAEPGSPSAAPASGVSVNAREREAFAQMQCWGTYCDNSPSRRSRSTPPRRAVQR